MIFFFGMLVFSFCLGIFDIAGKLPVISPNQQIIILLTIISLGFVMVLSKLDRK